MGFRDVLNRIVDTCHDSVDRLRESVWEPIRQELTEIREQVRVQFQPRQAMPRIGDVIGITRGIYEHFGVYVGKGRVIHYTSFDDSLTNNEVMETDIEHFLRGARSFFVVHFESINRMLQMKKISRTLLLALFPKVKRDRPYQLFSGEETVQRARSQIGKRRYHLILNNCEHFAFWCKTGERECQQFKTLFNRIYFTYPRSKEQSSSAPRAS